MIKIQCFIKKNYTCFAPFQKIYQNNNNYLIINSNNEYDIETKLCHQFAKKYLNFILFVVTLFGHLVILKQLVYKYENKALNIS